MKLKLQDYKIGLIVLLFCASIRAQNTVSGKVTSENNIALKGVKVISKSGLELAETNAQGNYQFSTTKNKLSLVFYYDTYQLLEKSIAVNKNTIVNVKLQSFNEELSEVEITAQKRKVFELKRLKDVEETAIYAGKKTEVVLVSQSTAAMASNNARQIYSQVAGLNIFQNDDAGLQLNIGGRGLDPNRTSNFNTRQNGYDISADVLGYPESYYTPPAEALEEIQVIRGAASLQYGTQFGGLVNFVLKKPNSKEEFEFLTRNTLGSNNLFTNFTSISGKKNKVEYFGYYNYKQGDGFRLNSDFNSKNAFLHVGYAFNTTTKLEAEITYLTYLAHQAGGLTDAMFAENPFQSNRTRNWFEVDWFLYNLKLSHRFSESTNFTFNFFGLDASRKAIGYRIRRIDLEDQTDKPRELLVSDFNNFGFETRLLNKYKIFHKKNIFLLGAKFYKANNSEEQGPGTNGFDANFISTVEQFPNYRIRGEFKNPNLNVSLFGENIFYASENLSITPGFRFEYIKTGSEGKSIRTNFDGAGNPIGNDPKIINKNNKRSFVLLGLGASYKPNASLELYGNISQNYRSISFSDLNIVNPSNGVDENLKDENGFTLDIGARGNWNQYISYDISLFGLFYNDRIGFLYTQIPPVNNYGQLRTNIGDARILGMESLLDFNLKKVLNLNNDFTCNYFINTSVLNSKYTRAITSGILNNSVEFTPNLNLKTGIRFGYKNVTTSIQYTYLSEQFTDASNAIINSNSRSVDRISGIVGEIPTYDVLDFSASYKYKMFKLETGVNNVLDTNYFTRRATGYPGPGIIPSAPRNWYVTFQFTM